jgi:hypothetical protein
VDVHTVPAGGRPYHGNTVTRFTGLVAYFLYGSLLIEVQSYPITGLERPLGVQDFETDCNIKGKLMVKKTLYIS